MAVRPTGARREGDLLVPQRSYCIGLGGVVSWVESQLAEYGPQVTFGFDVRGVLMAAVLNQIFYGTVCRGNRYFVAITELEHLGVPTDVALGIYNHAYTEVATLFEKSIPHPVNYTEFGYEFLTETDVLVLAIPLHDIPRMPVNDD